MTDKEAIKNIKELLKWYLKEEPMSETVYKREAVEMAIKALEQQPSDDCISREAVRRVLGNEVFELMKLHTVNPEDNPKADAMSYGVNWSLNTLMELPSVTPQRPKGKWIVDKGVVTVLFCSECGAGTMFKSPCCPYCGAEMNGGGEDETNN